jgi:hypothetical protein
MSLTRRELIKTGIVGGIVLACASCMRSTTTLKARFADDDAAYRVLDAHQREIVAALATAILAGTLPGDPHALVAAVRGVDVAISGLTPSVQSEVQQLFGLFANPVARRLALGLWSQWSEASTDDVTAFLTRWRFSSVTLFRSGYDAVHQLVMAGWYGGNASWAHLGYPGPPGLA